ncbi:MAG: transcription-repair coupling factor [Cyanobacteria bacterium SIG26]|nr:transcription-repair coupling factor [Cyanobacteria bacterium SIG26]
MFCINEDNISKNYEEFRAKVKNEKSFAITGLTSILRIFLLSKLKVYSKKKVLFITSTEQNALKYQSDLLSAFNIKSDVLPFQNISVYETVSPNLYDYAEQLKVLNNQSDIVICPVKSLLEKFPTKNFYKKNSLKIKVGDTLDLKKLAQKLVNLGYKKSTMVNDISEFSIRGDIADIYSLDENPVRIELWGDEVTDIRYFNNETQKSISKIKEIKILPIYKFIIDDKKDVLENIQSELIENSDQVPDEAYFDGIEVYQNYFNDELISVLDYFENYTLVFDETVEIFSKYEFVSDNFDKQLQENIKLGMIKDFSQKATLANFEKMGKNHYTYEEFLRKISYFVKVGFNNFIDGQMGDVIEFNAQPLRNFEADVDLIADFILEYNNYKIIIATDYPERVKEILAQKNIFTLEYAESIVLNGCILEDFKTVIMTDRELFNKRSKEVTTAKKSYFKEKPEFIENINDIKTGEFVVHTIHGLGIYKGLSKQEIDGQLKDYLTIEYANKDRLHIPAEQINMLCRYRGSGAIKPKLSKIGGRDWENTKAKVKKEVEIVAYDLLRLYARRKMQEGIQFLPDTNWQIEMEEAFEFVETPDQLKAISRVKADMESPEPMDRLICGDVGFGKTEVAMRAVFKAVTSGKQVAVIVPTTILALQHYQTISERFKPFGVGVELLSRFRTAKQQKDTIKNLATGVCDVVVGTHRLLQDGIIFKDLGLLVIDEEHRFGVRHKEKLKQMRENIDILSMSATPIPRTLYMSLSGIKDMSVINTPPKNRLPIKTYVGEWNENMVKNAIIHELDREGQVFYLYNRVETIREFKNQLQMIVPNARIAIGHGQMDEKELEQVIIDFSNHEYDILLATTIIENGIDIPNANTMIIHDADRFGLAQLYQLRGRVGRSQRQAYCYCFYKKCKEISTDAVNRLKAIKEFTTLGSGYQIALRDVEIRGVGNILGTKQHGHMINVGFDTYCELLEETVKELQGEKIDKTVPTIVDINVTAYIPDEWVGSSEQKMIEYKRLADVKTVVELDYIVDEWVDRFAKPPESVENLVKLIRLRLSATEVKIAAIREVQDCIRIYTPYSKPEWNIIQKVLPHNISKKIKFTLAPKTCAEGVSILILDTSYVNFNEVFNILTDLFYYIYKVSHEY